VSAAPGDPRPDADGQGPRGLLVDYGGVLTTNVWDSFSAFCDAEGVDRDEVKRLFRDRPDALALLRRLEVGELDEDQFAAGFGPLLGLGPERHGGLVDRLFAGMQPEESMIEALRQARAHGLPTGLISNSWGRGRYDRASFGELFDAVVISGEVGLHKPQPAIFRLGAERLGLEPGRCVFVDDLRENCEGAEAVGMVAVLHRDANATIERLEELLGVALR
jgi:epoxide hydrolase-like predicted phosphatase